MSGEASTTSPSLPPRSRSPVMASWRSASMVTQVPMRMRDDVDAPRAGLREHPQRHFELVAGGAGAFLVVDIVGGPAARRPGKQHRRAGIAGIVGDLGQRGRRRVEAGVVAMDEDHDAAAARGDIGVERAGELRLGVIADDLGSHEIFRPGRRTCRASGARSGRSGGFRNGDVDAGDSSASPSARRRKPCWDRRMPCASWR